MSGETFDMLRWLVNEQDEIIDILILVESGEIYEAISRVRSITGGDLVSSAKTLKKLVKEELDKDMLVFLDEFPYKY